MVPAAGLAQNRGAGGTLLYDSRAVALKRIDTDASGALWVLKSDLPRINGFELKPQGACRADICIPIPRAMMRGELFNLTAFATRVGQKFIADASARVWSFGEIPVVQGAYVESRIAPDVARSRSQRQDCPALAIPGKEGAARDVGILVRVPT
jgi:hypothetical protein